MSAPDPDRLGRFQREARTVAALNHPNIVTLYAVEESEGTPFLVMERVDGRPLGDATPVDGWPVAKILELAVPIADALAAAHGKGIVHRDLKPANVMLTSDGRVKVLDFGLASVSPAVAPGVESALPTATRTAEGRIVGTLPYMAPEQVRGERVDARTDIFAFGAVLYKWRLARARSRAGHRQVHVGDPCERTLRRSTRPALAFLSDSPGSSRGASRRSRRAACSRRSICGTNFRISPTKCGAEWRPLHPACRPPSRLGGRIHER